MGGEQEEGVMLWSGSVGDRARCFFVFSSQSTKNNGCHLSIILNNNEDRNTVVQRWLLTYCSGTKALLQLLIKKAALTFNCQQLQFFLKPTTWPRGFKQPNVAFNACSLSLVQRSSPLSSINATSTEPGCCPVLKTAVPLRKIKLSNGYTLLCCC